ncbi:LytR/AlgR family response regulator transcription factor [Pedobacter insulae]|uniref:LytTr DNA-binding domain-containing protein n=1 Tax=Pedobacter insulae TaxID=414048 RepID=A0A1I2Y2Z2_9SPHI|nr:LytTR family DNA-binding domain-containing protein [Pedobacter insulae]SFH20128.1 LytTr DNA-binding domain-containing protein [Pedobacter insulae]
MTANSFHSIASHKRVRYLALVFALFIAFTVFQDFLESHINGYSFFLSESLLFKTFWLLFLPILLFQHYLMEDLLSWQNKILTGLISILTPTILHLALFPLCIWLLSKSFFDHTYYYSRTFGYTIAEDFYKYIAIYSLGAFVNYYLQNLRSQSKQPSNELPKKLTFNTGKKYVTISVDEIIYIKTSAPYILVHIDGGQYLHNETLKSFGKKLANKQFIRVHKSTIINLQKVISYKSRSNGDYDISLIDGTIVRLSRNYSAEFKAYFSINTA